MRRIGVALCCLAPMLSAEIKLLVTVTDPKAAKAVTDLKAEDFSATDGDAVRRITEAKFTTGKVDTMLMVDSSLMGQMVQGPAAEFISQLEEKEQMALVAFHSSADMVQDFTSSRQTLLRKLGEIKYGNTPRALDALYAAMDGGFEHTVLRRIILLLTAGYEGGARVRDRDVVKLATKNGVSIFPLYLTGRERGLFEMLARRTGGAPLNLRDLAKVTKSPGKTVFDIVRGSYSVTMSGNLTPTEKFKVEVRGPRKLFVSALVLE